jgi:hypothetical protein
MELRGRAGGRTFAGLVAAAGHGKAAPLAPVAVEIGREAMGQIEGTSRSLADLWMEGEADFGFVTSRKPEVGILELSRFVDADEKLRGVKPQSQDPVFRKIEAVIAGIKEHATATGHEDGGRRIVNLFEQARWETLKRNCGKLDCQPEGLPVDEFLESLDARGVNREAAAAS